MNPAALPEQLRRAWAIAKKDIRLYYAKNSVLIFGVLMPVFLFLAFFMGSRQLPACIPLTGARRGDPPLHCHGHIPRHLLLGRAARDS